MRSHMFLFDGRQVFRKQASENVTLKGETKTWNINMET